MSDKCWQLEIFFFFFFNFLEAMKVKENNVFNVPGYFIWVPNELFSNVNN